MNLTQTTAQSPLFRIRHEGLWGYMNHLGETVIEPQFLTADDFSDELALVRTVDDLANHSRGTQAFIDRTGKTVIGPGPPPHDFPGLAEWQEFHDLEPEWSYSSFSEGLALFYDVRRELYGYVDRLGRIALPVVYSHACDFAGERAVVNVGDASVLIDRVGRIIQPELPCSHLSSVFEGQAVFSSLSTGLCGTISVEGKVIIDPKFDVLFPFKQGLAIAFDGDHAGFVDTNGEWVIPALYDAAYDFCDGRALVVLGDDLISLDRLGCEQNRCDVSRFQLDEESDGQLFVSTGSGKDEKIGYFDHHGKLVLPDDYRLLSSFDNGLALVASYDSPTTFVGYVNRNGEFVFRTREWGKSIW